MVIIRPGIGMANRTTEYQIISRRGMTVGTLVPFSLMFAAVYREILLIVVKIGGFPGRFRMAIRTSGREASRGVFGVGGLVIIGLVAPDAGRGRRRVVVPVQVAGIAGSRFMRAVQWIHAVVVKGGGHPSGFAVASFTIGGEIGCLMVRICRLVIVGDMTAGTSVGRAVVVALVAGGTIVGHGRMRPV